MNKFIFSKSHALAMLVLSIASQSGVAAPNEPENAAWNVNMSTNGANPAGYYGEWPGHTYYPSADDWRKQAVYQFITDRWADGNPSNNEGKYGGYDLRSVSGRHGGDFKGITKRLDYIKSLGYSAIWISPVFQNRKNSYHGYGQIDFTLLDDRFGTLEEFREMVNAAHARGIYVIVDIIANHLSDLYYFEGKKGQAAPFKLHGGEYKLFPYNANETYRDFWVNNTFFATGTYPTVYDYDGSTVFDTWGQGSYWFSDLHHNGDLANYGDPWQNHLGKIYGSLDDLRTTHPNTQDKIIAMTKSLVASTDIDGIRMDTPMQVPRYFFERWAPAVRQQAKDLGKDNFWLFGEFFCPRERAATMTGRGKTPAMYGTANTISGDYTLDGGIHYPTYWWFENAVKNQVTGHLGELKRNLDSDMRMYDFYNPARNEFRYTHLNFYNNHDQWRMASATDGFKKTDLSSAIIAFWPGVPLFYYGDEQGFKTNGTALDGWSREDMMNGLAWNNLPTVNGRNPSEGDSFNMTSPQFQWVQKLMNVRRHYPALQNTDATVERWKQVNDGNGIYAYSRIWGDKKNWALIAWNTWSAGLTAGGAAGTFNTGWNQGDKIINVLNTSETYILGAGGKLSSLYVGGYGVKVFVRADNFKALNPVVKAATPTHNQRVTSSNWTVRLDFSTAMNVDSVKAAFRFDGQPVPAASLTWIAANNRIEFNTPVSDGLHFVEVLDSAQAANNGPKMYGNYRLRFRKGADNNIIMNRTATVDNSLVQVMNAADGSVRLLHKATGAEKFRVKNEGGAWSDWQAYAPITDWSVSGHGTKKLSVQYWADNSAAYYVDSTFTVP